MAPRCPQVGVRVGVRERRLAALAGALGQKEHRGCDVGHAHAEPPAQRHRAEPSSPSSLAGTSTRTAAGCSSCGAGHAGRCCNFCAAPPTPARRRGVDLGLLLLAQASSSCRRCRDGRRVRGRRYLSLFSSCAFSSLHLERTAARPPRTGPISDVPPTWTHASGRSRRRRCPPPFLLILPLPHAALARRGRRRRGLGRRVPRAAPPASKPPGGRRGRAVCLAQRSRAGLTAAGRARAARGRRRAGAAPRADGEGRDHRRRPGGTADAAQARHGRRRRAAMLCGRAHSPREDAHRDAAAQPDGLDQRRAVL